MILLKDVPANNRPGRGLQNMCDINKFSASHQLRKPKNINSSHNGTSFLLTEFK